MDRNDYGAGLCPVGHDKSRFRDYRGSQSAPWSDRHYRQRRMVNPDTLRSMGKCAAQNPCGGEWCICFLPPGHTGPHHMRTEDGHDTTWQNEPKEADNG